MEILTKVKAVLFKYGPYALVTLAILMFIWMVVGKPANANPPKNTLHQDQQQWQQQIAKSTAAANSVSNAVNGGNSNKIDGDKAFGFGLGAAAFNECYRSYSVLVYQGSQLNALCLAKQFIVEGKYREAAQLRCHDGGIRKAITGHRWGKKARAECVERLVAQDYQTVKNLEAKILFLQNERNIDREKCTEAKNRITDSCYPK